MPDVKYPHVKAKLVRRDGNAFAILGSVMKAQREAKVQPWEIARFQKEATAGNYDQLLRTCMAWVDVA